MSEYCGDGYEGPCEIEFCCFDSYLSQVFCTSILVTMLAMLFRLCERRRSKRNSIVTIIENLNPEWMACCVEMIESQGERDDSEESRGKLGDCGARAKTRQTQVHHPVRSELIINIPPRCSTCVSSGKKWRSLCSLRIRLRSRVVEWLSQVHHELQGRHVFPNGLRCSGIAGDGNFAHGVSGERNNRPARCGGNAHAEMWIGPSFLDGDFVFRCTRPKVLGLSSFWSGAVSCCSRRCSSSSHCIPEMIFRSGDYWDR